MMTTELGACEWFVWDLRRSNLIERGQLEQLVADFLAKHPRAEPPDLAQHLIGQELLTPFQAERLLAGKTQGFVLGPYTLTDALGTGSMGTVYRAQNKNDQKWYAVKVLPRRSMWNIRIARRKVRDFERLDHPAIVPFSDVGTAGGQHYLAWPLVEGTPLEKVVTEQGKLSHGVAAALILKVAEGLEVCHRAGVIHGLLKPSNLLVDPDREVKILDFGVGCLLAETENESVVDTMSTANTMASGLDCASPESIEDPKHGMTPAADQYSLGCVLYFCLTGRYPFPGTNAVEKMMAHQLKQPAPVRELAADVPEELAKVVERLMSKKPDARFASMGDVAAALRPFAAQAERAPLRAALRARAAAPTPASPRQDTRGRPVPTAALAAPEPVRPGPNRSSALPGRDLLKPMPNGRPARARDDNPRDDNEMGPLGVGLAVVATMLAAALVGYLLWFH